jgi:hypothetical protein
MDVSDEITIMKTIRSMNNIILMRLDFFSSSCGFGVWTSFVLGNKIT